MIPAKFKVDIFEELKNACDFSFNLFVVDKTLDELKKLQNVGTGKEKRAAKLALSLIKNKKLKIIKTSSCSENVDDILVRLSKKGAVVATQDLALKRRLKSKKIVLRQKKYLKLV